MYNPSVENIKAGFYKLNLLNKKDKRFFQIIWTNPIMFYTQHNYFRDYYLGKIESVPNMVKSSKIPIIILSGNNWYWDDKKYRKTQHEYTLRGFKKYINDFKHVRIILMHPDEEFIAGYDDIEYILFNRNALIDPDAFQFNITSKLYDAVYNANFYDYKRHYLLKSTKNVALIYYLRDNKNKIMYINERELRGGVERKEKYINSENFYMANMVNGEYKYLSFSEISSVYNQSFCGLCLSDIEGACLTSTEYLLSGIPVVSTKNHGGRNKFLKKMGQFAITDLEPDSNIILEAINHFKNININGQIIRKNIIDIINEEWDDLFFQLKKKKINIYNHKEFMNSCRLEWKKYLPLL